MQLIAQIALVVIFIINIFAGFYRDINGQKAKQPAGFEGIICTTIGAIIIFVIYYFAGAFNLLFN